MSIETYTIVCASLFGLCIGSFLNVLIHRLPRGQGIVRSRSQCTKCRAPIAWHDNIPVLSYLFLGGRCRRCRKRISIRYPIVELTSAVAAAVIVHRYGLTLKAVWIYSFVSILLVITLIDWFHKIIPDSLSLGGVVLGWAGSFICLDVRPLESFAGSLMGGGIIIAIAVLYRVIRKVEGMGGGDVKLMAMIGAFVGWKMVFPVLFIASLMGSVYGLYLMKRGDGGGQTAVAFGSFLAPSATLVFFVGTRLWQLYLDFYRG